MSDLRKAAEMALYALKDARCILNDWRNISGAYEDEIKALRQALAQPEPKPTLFFGRAVYFADPKTGEVKTQPEQESEPVYIMGHYVGNGKAVSAECGLLKNSFREACRIIRKAGGEQ